MKRILILFIMTLVLCSGAVLADNDTDAGTTPDSLFWGLDVALDNIRLSLASDDTRAEKALQVAEERLSEIREMAEEGKVDRSERARRAHQKVMERLQRDLERADDKKDDTDKYRQEIDIETKILEHQQRVQQLRLRIDGQLNEEQQAALDNLLATLGDDVSQVEIRIRNKAEQTRQRLDLSEDELDEIENPRYEHLAGVAQAQAEREIARAEAKIARFQSRVDEDFREARGVDRDASQRTEKKAERESSRNTRTPPGLTMITGRVTATNLSENVSDDNVTDGNTTDMNMTDDGNQTDTNQTNSTDDNSTDEAECQVDADCDENEYCSEELECEDLNDESDESDDSDSDVDDSESDDDDSREDNILRQYGLSVPDYEERSVNTSLRLLEEAREALAVSRQSSDAGDHKAAYAYARFAKKLANEAASGKYLRMSDLLKDRLDELEDELDEEEEELEDAECVVDADCDADEYCSEELECEDLDEAQCESHADCSEGFYCDEDECEEKECSVDSDCDADEYCSEEFECEDVEESDEEDDSEEDNSDDNETQS